MFKFPLRPSGINKTTTLRSLSLLSSLFGATKMSDPGNPTLTIHPYTPSNPSGPFPYTTRDMTPMDPGNDASFYAPPRFVTHIDDNAIISLKRYYDSNLPRKGVILDFCSSWISHYPPGVYNAAVKREEHRARGQKSVDTNEQGTEGEGLVVLGTGMNQAELSANPVLKAFDVQDLNQDPDVRIPREQGVKLDASTCVVSIDYLTRPVDVLRSIREVTVEGGSVHLAVSNRCFPTKVVGRWLRVGEEERLEMVGDYLWWAGWREVEIVEVVKGGFMTDPLWVVRGRNVGGGEGS